jgi:hypothetical protein
MQHLSKYLFTTKRCSGLFELFKKKDLITYVMFIIVNGHYVYKITNAYQVLVVICTVFLHILNLIR